MEQYKPEFDRNKLNDTIRNGLSCLDSIHGAREALWQDDTHGHNYASARSESDALLKEYLYESDRVCQSILPQLPPSVLISGQLEVVDEKGECTAHVVENEGFIVSGANVELSPTSRHSELVLYLSDPQDSEQQYRWRYNDGQWSPSA